MVAGNPDKIAFIIEKVSDWSSCGCTNGILYLYLNGKQYPQELRTVTIDGELYSMLSGNSPLVAMPVNEKIFSLSPQHTAEYIYELACENGNYTYSVPFQELEDTGYYLFMVCSNSCCRFVLAHSTGADSVDYTDEIVISNNELSQITDKIKKFRESLMA